MGEQHDDDYLAKLLDEPALNERMRTMRERLAQEKQPCGHSMLEWLGFCFACARGTRGGKADGDV